MERTDARWGISARIVQCVLFFAMSGGVIFPSYAEVSRDDLILYQLEYYDVKTAKERVQQEKEAAQRREEEVRKAAEEAKKQEAVEESTERKEKIKKTLRDIAKDFVFLAELETRYDDNVFLSHDDPEADFVTALVFSLRYEPEFVWKKGHTKVFLNMTGGPNVTLSNNDDLNEEEYAVNGGVTYTRGKYTGSIYGGMEKTYSAASNFVLTGDKKLVDYRVYEYGGLFAGDLKYFPFQIDYSSITKDYEKEFDNPDVTTNEVSFTHYLKFFPKTDFFFAYDYGTDEYPHRDIGDASYNTFWGGLKGRVSPKINGTVKVGYKMKEFDSGKDVADTAVRVDLDYALSEHLKSVIGLRRDIVPTTVLTEEYTNESEVRLRLGYLPPLTRRLGVGIELKYINYDYESGREDDLYQGKIFSELALKQWLKWVFSYTHAERISNEANAEYQNNIFSSRVIAQF